jgi:hypothetical protein
MGGSSRLVTGLLLLVVGIVLGAYGFKQRSMAKQIEREGVTVPAHAVEHRIVPGRRGRRSYKIVAEYQTRENGQSYRKEFSVTQTAFEASKGGGPVTVSYLTSDPNVAMISGDANDGVLNIGAGAAMAVIGAGMGLYAVLKRA